MSEEQNNPNWKKYGASLSDVMDSMKALNFKEGNQESIGQKLVSEFGPAFNRELEGSEGVVAFIINKKSEEETSAEYEVRAMSALNGNQYSISTVLDAMADMSVNLVEKTLENTHKSSIRSEISSVKVMTKTLIEKILPNIETIMRSLETSIIPYFFTKQEVTQIASSYKTTTEFLDKELTSDKLAHKLSQKMLEGASSEDVQGLILMASMLRTLVPFHSKFIKAMNEEFGGK